MKKVNAQRVVRSSFVEFGESAIVKTSQLYCQNAEWARECRAGSQEGARRRTGDGHRRVGCTPPTASCGRATEEHAHEGAATDACRRAPVRGSAQKDAQHRTRPLSERRSSGGRGALEKWKRECDRSSRDGRTPGRLLSVRLPQESEISDDGQMLRLRQQCRRRRA